MHFDELIHFCFQLPGATETFPFDKRTLVMKVQNKMFALVDVDDFDAINLKCDPEKAIELRESFQGVQPGFHMNKTHWNSVYLNEDVSDQLLAELIDHSYELVYASLPKKVRNENPI